MSRTIGWIIGGLLTGSGIMMMIFSFGAKFGDFSTSIAQAGWDGIGDIGVTGVFPFAVLCIVCGGATLISLNATAWKHTDGY